VKRLYLAIETAGTWYHQAVELQYISSGTGDQRNGDAKEITYLCQQLSGKLDL